MYRFLAVFVSVFAVLLFASPVFAAKNDEALSILSHLYVTNGQLPVNDIVIEYEEMSSDADAPMQLSSKDKLYFKKPVKIRVDSIMVDPGSVNDGKNLIIIRDGVNAWLYLSSGQYPVKKQLDEQASPFCLPFGLTHYPKDLEKEYMVEGKESVDGVGAVKVSITDSTAQQFVWIDTSRWVPLKFQSTTKDGNKETTKMTLYKNIGQTKDGRYFPMRLERYVDGRLTNLIVYKGLVVNAGLSDDLFSPLNKLLQ